MERSKLGKTGELLLGTNIHNPEAFKDPRTYKTGPNFLNKYSNKPPTHNELDQAQTSLTLLKSKMQFKPNSNFNSADMMTRNYGFDFQNNQQGRMNSNSIYNQDINQNMDNGNNRYRKIFRPENTMLDIERKEKMLVNNIGMLNENLDIQKEILGTHKNNQGRSNIMQNYNKQGNGLQYRATERHVGGYNNISENYNSKSEKNVYERD